ncbi:MAG: threonine ammonia-lyase IlvA [Aureispira sp.]|nr:threonine ammonia-lyase IlvA [Aureispira sp.]
METLTCYRPKLENIQKAHELLKTVVLNTPTEKHRGYSEKYNAEIYFKREDLQLVRSYKLRGAYNKICSLSSTSLENGVVCASAGNHAQGVAYACRQLEVHACIFMPITTPQQKVLQVRMFGGQFVEVVLLGDTFDDSLKAAKSYGEEKQAIFIHPFDDPKIIEGQATVACEILDAKIGNIDILILPIGGGGLAAGVSSVFKLLSPNTKIIGVEPAGAASMDHALQEGVPKALSSVDKFIDGAAVKCVGALTFDVCKSTLDQVIAIPEGLVCKTMLQLYNEYAMVVEPAGALSLAALELLKTEVKGKRVVCIVSGGNNDISRTEEIRERALLYEELKHYFIVNFPQRAGALREFVIEVLGETDNIVYFQYTRKNNREKGPAVVGIELKQAEDLAPLLERMKANNNFGQHLNEQPDLFHFLV